MEGKREGSINNETRVLPGIRRIRAGADEMKLRRFKRASSCLVTGE